MRRTQQFMTCSSFTCCLLLLCLLVGFVYVFRSTIILSWAIVVVSRQPLCAQFSCMCSSIIMLLFLPWPLVSLTHTPTHTHTIKYLSKLIWNWTLDVYGMYIGISWCIAHSVWAISYVFIELFIISFGRGLTIQFWDTLFFSFDCRLRLWDSVAYS